MMPVADIRRARARPARPLGWAGALLLGAALAAGAAAARDRGNGNSHHGDDDRGSNSGSYGNSGNGGGNYSSGGGSDANASAASASGPGASASAGGGNGNGNNNNNGYGNNNGSGGNSSAGNNGRGSGGGFDSNPFNPSPSQPSLGFGFNNDGASLSIRTPIGSAPHAVTPVPHEAPRAPLLSIPFGGHNARTSDAPRNSLSHALSYGDSPLGGAGGANPALTNRLIHSVTSTLSDHFVNNLGQSLRNPAERTDGAGTASTPGAAPAPAALVRGSPAAVVRERFTGIAGNAFEPRIFAVPTAGERFVANEVVVGVPADLPAAQLAAFAARNGLAPVGGGVPAAGITLQRWRITDARPVGEVIRALQADADVQAAQPNYRFRLAQAAGLGEMPATAASVQYAPVKLHLAQAHELSTGQGVLVAVIDTGIDEAHPEIAGAIAASFDAVGGGEPPDSHGTGIAGAIVAHGRLTGVAPGARLIAVRAFDNSGPDAEATTVTIVRSIEWAIARGARVINMSFAGARDPLIARSIATARRKGIVLVAAAGNAGPNSPPLYPAADPNVIAVSATDVDDHLLEVANRGGQVAITAPGVELLLPAPGARYQIATGTSFAAAHVAGIAALIIARNPQTTPDLVRNVLVSTARDLGPKGRDDLFGAGLADAYKAVLAAGAGGAQTLATAKP
jgi:hypothetical protein